MNQNPEHGANESDADTPPASEKPKETNPLTTHDDPGVESPSQGTDGTSPPSYTGESGDNESDPEQIRRREAYDRPPE